MLHPEKYLFSLLSILTFKFKDYKLLEEIHSRRIREFTEENMRN